MINFVVDHTQVPYLCLIPFNHMFCFSADYFNQSITESALSSNDSSLKSFLDDRHCLTLAVRCRGNGLNFSPQVNSYLKYHKLILKSN